MRKMNRMISLVLAFVMIASLWSPLTVQATEEQNSISGATFSVENADKVIFDGGSGTKDDPYLISTVEQLKAVNDNLTSSFKLCNDLDLSGEENWVPIGGNFIPFEANSEEEFNEQYEYDNTYYIDISRGREYFSTNIYKEGVTTYYKLTYFSGNFDGDNHTIKNINIIGNDGWYYGFFGYVKGDGLRIENLNLDNLYLYYDGSGYIYESDNEYKSYANGSRLIGGIAGGGYYGNQQLEINNCSVNGQIEVKNAYAPHIGGIVGTGFRTNQCINMANIILASTMDDGFDIWCGGIFGSASSGDTHIKDVNYGSITSEATRLTCGGIGGDDVGPTSQVIQCVNFGTISTKTGTSRYVNGDSLYGQSNYDGGIIGNTSGYIGECINYGSIYGEFVGECGDSYGHNVHIGGISARKIHRGSQTNNCYYNGKELIAKRYKNSNGNLIRAIAYKIETSTGDTKNCYSSSDAVCIGTDNGANQEPQDIWDGIPISDEELKIQSTYTDFDFENVWAMDSEHNGGYPYLKWTKDYVGAGVGELKGNKDIVEDKGSVRFFKEWDAENKIAYFGQDDMTGSQVTDETDTSFLENVDNLVGQYVFAETKARTDNLIAPDILISIRPIETKIGTVIAADTEIITIGEETYATPNGLMLPDSYVGEIVLYHVYEGKIKGIEILEKEEGILTYWNSESREVRIGESYTLSPLADDETIKFLGETGSRHDTVYYYADDNKFVYDIVDVSSKDDPYYLTPESGCKMVGFGKLTCSIDFNDEVNFTDTGKAYLVDYDTDNIIEEVPLASSNLDTEIQTSERTGKLSKLIISFNKKGTLLDANSKYYILVDADAIEYSDDANSGLGKTFEGITDKDTWNFKTVSFEYPLVTNHSAADKIPLSMYNIIYKPLSALKIRNRDDGSKGICWGFTYAVGAWNDRYSAISSIGADQDNMMEFQLDTKGNSSYTFLEYLQLAQIYRYKSNVAKAQNLTANKVDEAYQAIINSINGSGPKVILNVINSKKKGHAVFPLGIISEDEDSVTLAVYNCNGNGESLSGWNFISKMKLLKEDNKFVDWKFLDYNDGSKAKLKYYLIDNSLDQIVLDSNIQKEQSNMLVSKTEIEGMEELEVVADNVNNEEKGSSDHLYWYDDTAFTRLPIDSDENAEIGITDGFKALTVNSPLNSTVELDINSGTVNITCKTESEYYINNDSADENSDIHSVRISGSANGSISTMDTDNGIVLTSNNLFDVTITTLENENEIDSITFSSDMDSVEISVDDNGIHVCEDSDGDGTYDRDITRGAHIHTYDYTDNGDGTHTKSCVDGDDTSVEEHSYVDGVCEFCGAKEHVHSYGKPVFYWSDDYSSSKATFTCACSDSRTVDAKVTVEETAATCTEDGKKVYTATATYDGVTGSDTETVTILAKGHQYVDTVVPPTEDEQGYTEHTCSECGDTYRDTYTDPIGEHKHTWDEGVIDKEATCTEDGEITYTCNSCEETKTEVIKATGHDYHNGVCSECGDKQASVPVTPVKPVWKSWFEKIIKEWIKHFWR